MSTLLIYEIYPQIFQLECQPIQEQEIYQLRYFMEYQWLVNFSLYAALVYLSTEIYSYYSSIENEINLSMLWCSIVIVFALYPFII